MMRAAGPQDRAEVEARLEAHIDGAMFPLANLRAHGMGNGEFASNHPHSTRFWLSGNDGVIALTREGTVLPVLGEVAPLGTLRDALAGLLVAGVVGQARSARPVLAALGLAGHPTRLDKDEPGFSLALSDLRLAPKPGFRLQPLAPHRALATHWRTAAKVETDGLEEAESRSRATADIDGWIASDSHRILLHDGVPVAMTGFNARLPEIVQVGGVYTPPDRRNRGYARMAVALHLAEVRAHGASRAVLFAATPAAARAYRALGFQPAPDFTLVLFRQPVAV